MISVFTYTGCIRIPGRGVLASSGVPVSVCKNRTRFDLTSVLFISKSYAFVAAWKKLVVFVTVPEFSGSVRTARSCIFKSCFKRLEDVHLNHHLVELVAEVAKLEQFGHLILSSLPYIYNIVHAGENVNNYFHFFSTFFV